MQFCPAIVWHHFTRSWCTCSFATFMKTREQYDLAPPTLRTVYCKTKWSTLMNICTPIFLKKKEQLHTLIYLVLYWQLVVSFPCKEEMHESLAPNLELWRISFLIFSLAWNFIRQSAGKEPSESHYNPNTLAYTFFHHKYAVVHDITQVAPFPINTWRLVRLSLTLAAGWHDSCLKLPNAAFKNAQCWGVTRKIRMTTLTQERVLSTF
jgi:hypothetical protein